MNIDKNISTKIENGVAEFYNYHVKELKNIITGDLWKNALESFKQGYIHSKYEEYINKIYIIMISIELCSMDAYLLARLFRSMQWNNTAITFLIYVGEADKKKI
jgi:hypothetical protein